MFQNLKKKLKKNYQNFTKISNIFFKILPKKNEKFLQFSGIEEKSKNFGVKIEKILVVKKQKI